MIILLLPFVIDGIHSKESKSRSINKTGRWISENTKTDAMIYTNNLNIAYYSKRQTNLDPSRRISEQPSMELSKTTLEKFTHAAINITHQEGSNLVNILMEDFDFREIKWDSPNPDHYTSILTR